MSKKDETYFPHPPWPDAVKDVEKVLEEVVEKVEPKKADEKKAGK